MGHAIHEHDRLCVGFTELYGEAWHRHENCTHVEGAVPLQFAEEIFDFEVEKRPAFVAGADGEIVEVPGQFHVVDTTTGTVLSRATVGEQYDVVQNSYWLASIVGGVIAHNEVSVESCGTLYNRRRAFLNACIMEHTVKGDVSPTRTRMLWTNGFDGRSYHACAHQVRVVCQNTVRAAMAQGAANKTLRKFRHTAGAVEALGAYVTDLADLIGAIQVHNDNLDHLASQGVTPAFVKRYLEHLFKYNDDAEEGRGKTLAASHVDAVTAIFETKDDLNAGGIRHTKYSLFNAVTDWADHDAPVRGTSDSMSRELAGITGNRDKLKQRALTMLA
jgi:phage/plasmid-like protein (TIGR03299 family)